MRLLENKINKPGFLGRITEMTSSADGDHDMITEKTLPPRKPQTKIPHYNINLFSYVLYGFIIKKQFRHSFQIKGVCDFAVPGFKNVCALGICIVICHDYL